MSEHHLVVRAQPSLKQLLEQVAEARGETVSVFVRRAIRVELARLSYLTPEEKKALGIQVQSSELPHRQRREK